MKRFAACSRRRRACDGRGVLAQTRRPVSAVARGWREHTPTSTPTAADFFNDHILQDVRLDINSRDWETLKVNFESNAYYPCHVHLGQQRRSQRRDPIARELEPQRHQAGSARRLQPLHRRTDVSRTEIVRPAQQHDRLLEHARTSQHAAVRPDGRTGLARSARAAYVNNTYVGLYTIVESVDKTFLQRVFGENDGYLYSYERNPGDEPYYFDYVGPDQDLVRAASVQAGDARDRSAAGAARRLHSHGRRIKRRIVCVARPTSSSICRNSSRMSRWKCSWARPTASSATSA